MGVICGFSATLIPEIFREVSVNDCKKYSKEILSTFYLSSRSTESPM